MKSENLKIAVLIDGDNASTNKIENTLAKISKHGVVAIKRVYGDWSRQNHQCWKDFTNKHTIKPMQSYGYRKGKNSTESAIIIDAMDILHLKEVNTFCIVSSYCVFTCLVHRIKGDGLLKIGFVKNFASSSFKDACDLFLIEHKEMREEIPLNRNQLKELETVQVKELFKIKFSSLL